jgi:hypothetical protein
MICATRRQLAWVVVRLSPVIWSSAKTSQSRNEARKAPLGSMAISPTTSAWAFSGFQLLKRGVTARPSGWAMKARLSMGLNSPERSRSAATTRAISTLNCRAASPSATKSGTAIGSGSTLPLVISTVISARAGAAKTTVIAQTATRAANQRGVFMSCFIISSASRSGRS